MTLTYVRVLTLATLLVTGSLTYAQAANLVPNPDFDTGTSGWIWEPSGLGQMGLSSDGSPVAPSLRMFPGSNLTVRATSACITVTPGQYDLFVNCKDVYNGNECYVELDNYSDAACTTSEGVTASTLGSTPVPLPNGWYYHSTQKFSMFAGTQSVRVAVGARATTAYVYFDHVRFGPAGSTPVTLQSFEVD